MLRSPLGLPCGFRAVVGDWGQMADRVLAQACAQAVDQSHGLVTRLARSAEQVVGLRRVGQQMIGIDTERADFRG